MNFAHTSSAELKVIADTKNSEMEITSRIGYPFISIDILLVEILHKKRSAQSQIRHSD
jgi:hypothetical protein